ncbi:MAG TPA: IclR family transcriptional regulator C-terminal domain-containing protein [Methylomirabilota bacterium]|nr:IclR family transcriptional regulator C-terminal domain-containing protein [Methylomirabilota bacterium]
MAIRRVKRRAGHAGAAVEHPLFVQSVEKAFRVLRAFDASHQTMGVSQIAATTGLDKSAAQRFAHTLEELGYLRKDPDTRRYELTTRTLDLGYHYVRASALVERAIPYLLHLSQTTEEAVNLAVLDATEIVFVSRFMSRQLLNTDVIVGTRLPAYCTAAGIAILSRLPTEEARAVLDASELRPFTPKTTWRMPDLVAKLRTTASHGYATAFEEIYPGDLSVAAAILGGRGRPVGAIAVSASKTRVDPNKAEARFAPLVVAAARSLSDAPAPLAR